MVICEKQECVRTCTVVETHKSFANNFTKKYFRAADVTVNCHKFPFPNFASDVSLPVTCQTSININFFLSRKNYFDFETFMWFLCFDVVSKVWIRLLEFDIKWVIRNSPGSYFVVKTL